jgi:hypothetical protein
MSPYAALVTGFGLVLAAMVGLEVLARTAGERFRTVGEALHAALLARLGRWSTAGRWVTMLVWMWLGFHLLAR